MSLSRGSRNLLLLAIGSTLVAIITTSISLAVYHASGDIYLDRSRPGFLPDEQEESENQRRDTKYTFPDSGPIDSEAIDEYLENIHPALDSVEQLTSPFPSDSISDESLGITVPKTDPDLDETAPLAE